MLPQALDSLLNLLYPQFCHVCAAKVFRRADGVACERCWRRTRLLSENLVQCYKCATPLTGFAAPAPFGRSEPREVAADRILCHRCDDHFYDLARAAGIYENALAATILNLKLKPHLPARLRDLVVDAFDAAPFPAIDAVIPVPLSKARRLERGFNQAELLAGIVARHAGLQLDSTSLVRAGHTKIQRAPLDRRGRELTVENAFEVANPAAVAGRSLLLVDDVLTSGATVSACAKTLRKHGAAGVSVLTAARAARS